MANEVCLKTDCLHIKRGGIELEVKKEKKVFGTLTVSNATISWFPKNARKAISMSWSDFDALVNPTEEAVQ